MATPNAVTLACHVVTLAGIASGMPYQAASDAKRRPLVLGMGRKSPADTFYKGDAGIHPS